MQTKEVQIRDEDLTRALPNASPEAIAAVSAAVKEGAAIAFELNGPEVLDAARLALSSLKNPIAYVTESPENGQKVRVCYVSCIAHITDVCPGCRCVLHGRRIIRGHLRDGAMQE